MQVKLIKMKSSHKNLRTDAIEGECFKIPEIGESFHMISEPLEEGYNVRTITTSPVKKVQYDEEINTYTFKTTNSTYSLIILGENETEN